LGGALGGALNVVLELIPDAEVDLSSQGFFEGDIKPPAKKTRNGIFKQNRWTDGVVYYEPPSDAEKAGKIRKAMDFIEANTCIRFVVRTDEPSYISYIENEGCSSAVGMESANGRPQQLSLAPSCWSIATIVHEHLHALGLWHEQSRYDRDQYVTINMANVNDTKEHNFEMKTQATTSTYGVPYNYQSIMHYPGNAFTRNGQDTIVAKDPAFQSKMGNRDFVPDTDYEKIRRIYDCPASTSTQPPNTILECRDKAGNCLQYKEHCGAPELANLCDKMCGVCS